MPCLTGCTSPSSNGGKKPAVCATKKCPNTGKYGKAITIEGSDEFKKKTRKALDEIKKTPTGAKMLKSIENSGKKVTIKETSNGNGAVPDNLAKAKKKVNGTHGNGTNTTIKFNPNTTEIADGSETWTSRPAAIGLAHELIHAEHFTNGKLNNSNTVMHITEENMTVGVPPHDKLPFTENKIRDEWTPKQPKRPRY